jgi:hypothetical protein
VAKINIFLSCIKNYYHFSRSLPLDIVTQSSDSLYALVLRFRDYRSRGSGSDFRRYRFFFEVVDQERGPLSLVRINEELLE